MTLAELDRWALERDWGARKRAEVLRVTADFTVLAFDRPLCAKWAEVTVGASRNGRPIACADAWVAATAPLHGLSLITHNSDHYAGVDGLQVISA